jgi:mannitol/fructose-specific phosphotransferase system IIA component (Ntr-type)
VVVAAVSTARLSTGTLPARRLSPVPYPLFPLGFDSPWHGGYIPAPVPAPGSGFHIDLEPDVNMELREFLAEEAIQLDLKGESKDEILKELIALLGVDEKSQGILFKMLKRRENLGSTGIGRNIAIPHCRSLVVNRLRLAFGRKPGGVDFKAIDDQPVNYFFLIVAPPLEVSNQYLPVLGRIAQFAKDEEVAGRLAQLQGPREFLALLEEKGV